MPTQILITILLSIDHWHSSRYELKVYIWNSPQMEIIYDKSIFFSKLARRWKSKKWAKFELECIQLIFIYSNLKIKVTCKMRTLNAYIRTHTKEKPSKIFNIFFLAILPFYLKTYSNWIAIMRSLESIFSWWNHHIHFKMIHFNIKMQNPDLINLKCITYTQPIPLSWSSKCKSSSETFFVNQKLKVLQSCDIPTLITDNERRSLGI